MLRATLLLSLLVLAQRASATCTYPWVPNGNYCYLVKASYASNLTWSEARQTCVSMYGADLVSITTPQEQAIVRGLVKQAGETKQVWIGVNDRVVESVFAWSDGSGNLSSPAFTNWLVGEPNNANDEDCGTMNAQGFWNDVVCNSMLGYVCKRSISSTIPPPPPVANFSIATSQNCGGWYSFSGYCYSYNSKKVNFVQAEAACFSQGATLVNILTASELSYLKEFMKKMSTASFYIGLNDRLTEGTYVWDDGTLKGLSPSSTVSNWGKGEPNDDKHSEDCAEFLPYPRLTWNDLRCNTKRAYMCKRMSSSNATWTPITTPKRTKCPSGYSSYSHPNGATYCYKLFGNTYSQRRTWYSARTACANSGTGFELVSIHDHLERNFITRLIANKKYTAYYFWTGLNDRSSEGGYIWSDGSPTDYVYWLSGQPNRYQGSHDCTMMYRTSGRWNDNNCGYRSAYICKYTLVPRPLKKGTPVVTTRYCQVGWHQYQSYCYYAMPNTNVTHNQAIAACNGVGMKANLTSVNSFGEQAFIMSILGLHNASVQVHIGINDMKVEGEFVWTDGSLVTYTNWGFNQPNDWRRSQDCTILDHRYGLWNDVSCNVRRGYVCKKLRDQVVNPATTSKVCQPGWQQFKGMCYMSFTTAMSQANAEASCAAVKNINGLPGHLATISSRFVNYFLSSLVTANVTSATTPSRAFWFGLNDIGSEGAYKYTSKAPITFSHWASGQPDNWHNNENCVEFWSSTGQWNDKTCTSSLPFICSMYNNSVSVQPPPPTSPSGSLTASCPVGWLKYGTFCYGFFGSINKLTIQMDVSRPNPAIIPNTWTQARTSCMAMGANLVTIRDAGTQKFVASSVTKYTTMYWVWLGLNDRDDEGGYVWADQSPVTYTNWSVQQPNDYSGSQDCVELIVAPWSQAYHNAWNDNSCNSQEGYVCEFPAGATLPKPTAMPFLPPPGMKKISCPAGWTATDGECYQVQPIATTRNTFTNAERKCKSIKIGMAGVQPHLASVHSAKDHLILATLLTNTTGAGGVNNTQFWIGLQDRGVEGIFNWTDKSTVNYNGWSEGQPNNWRGTQDCVEIRMDTGYLFNDQACSNVLPYVCGFSRFVPSNVSQPTPPPKYANLKCNPGWMKFGTSCYKEFSQPRFAYDEAYMNCTMQGGDLLIVNSKAEQTFVTSRVTSGAISEYVWIGLTDEDRESYWRWADGTPLRGYSRWGPGQPNNFKNEDCVAIHSSDSMWYDRDCSEPHSFICEISVLTFNYTSNYTTPSIVNPTASTANGQNGGRHANKHTGLSTGAEVGIAVGIILSIGVIGVIVFVTIRRRGRAAASIVGFARLSTNADDDDDDDALLADAE